jgi:hypothetical protein
MEKSPSWEASSYSASQEIPRLLWNRKFITVFARSRNWTLSWASCIQSAPSQSIALGFVLILSFHTHFSLPDQNFTCISRLPHAFYILHPYHLPWFDHTDHIWWSVQITKLLIMQSSPASRYFLLLCPNIFLSTLFWNTLSLRYSLSARHQVSHVVKP